MKILVLLVLCLSSISCFAQNPINGDLKENNEGSLVIWSNNANAWQDIESFWVNFSSQNGDLTWGKTDQYPEYSKVKENDTLLIQSNKGVCLMEFYHQRWRRANDVRRWNDKLNNYSGCPYVFD